MTDSKTWKLVAPDWISLDTVWRNPFPFVLWPVGDQPLLAHWMDEAVRRGIREIELYVADRPAEVRMRLEDGAYWSLQIKVIPLGAEADAPADAERIEHLPGEASPSPAPENSADLFNRWFEMQKLWLARRTPGEASLDTRHPSGGWIGRRARIHPSAQLIAPFWIGAHAQIGANCQIGPNALVGEYSVLDSNVHVEEACVLANTFLGQNTRLFRSAAEGGALLDMKRDCRVDIGQRFVMGPVIDGEGRPGLTERAIALTAFLLLAPVALLWNRAGWIEQHVTGLHSQPLRLTTGRSGPLWVRRWPWIKEIIHGRLRWIGVLPRKEDAWKEMTGDLSHRLRSAPPGIFSLADAHGCHDASEPEELIHATYQGLQAGPGINRTVIRNMWKIAWSKIAS